MHITEPPDMVGVFSPHGYTDGKGIKRDLNVGSTSPSHRTSIYFSDILRCRLNSFTGSLEVSTLLILEGKRLAREFASSD